MFTNPSTCGHPQPSGSYDATGFHLKRMEFDPDYDNDAECIVADMEFNEYDSPADVQLKLQMLMLYNRCALPCAVSSTPTCNVAVSEYGTV